RLLCTFSLRAALPLFAEERYVQSTRPAPLTPPLPGAGPPAGGQQRVLRSDYVIVPGPAAGSPWIGVREVPEINGEPVEGEHGRLDRKSTRLNSSHDQI